MPPALEISDVTSLGYCENKPIILLDKISSADVYKAMLIISISCFLCDGQPAIEPTFGYSHVGYNEAFSMDCSKRRGVFRNIRKMFSWEKMGRKIHSKSCLAKQLPAKQPIHRITESQKSH